jgi:CopG family nickel-responsive transcriptional regulator
MPIVSISLNKRILKEIDAIQDEMGFSGRSETIRAAIRMLMADKRENEDLVGVLDATLLVIHDENASDKVSKIRHDFQDLIKTQIHNHLENDKCLEIFVVNGKADRIKMMKNSFQVDKDLDYVKLIVA